MTFKGWIELKDKQYAVHTHGEDHIVVQLYRNGEKVADALKSYSKEEFRSFLQTISVDISLLGDELRRIL